MLVNKFISYLQEDTSASITEPSRVMTFRKTDALHSKNQTKHVSTVH